MGAKTLPEDPSFPQLGIAGDPESMREVFQRHFLPLGEKAYHVRDCHLSGVRYGRDGTRCVLQYTLRLAEADTGYERIQWVTSVMYAGDQTRRRWEKLRTFDPGEIPDVFSTFEPFSFIPELGMLVQVFPYDRRLPTLPPLMAGPSPELEPLLLARFGPGDWRTEAWTVEPIQYRAEWRAILRLTVRAQDDATGATEERRFYVKVYRNERGEQTYRTLQALRGMADAGGGFTVGGTVAYLSHLRALVLEEAPGTSLEQVLLRGRGAVEAARKVARALAAFNQADVTTTRRHPLPDQVAALERAGNLLRRACPHLRAEVEAIIDAVVAGLEEVPPGPTHRDFKADHAFLDGERVVFIDFDSFAGSDPVLDPAFLLARLAAMPDRLPVPRLRIQTAARAFAEEYFAHVPRAWRGRLPVRYAGALLEVAPGFFRRQGPDWPDRIATLVEEARNSLAGRIW
jgi:phosphotransferase family enzyme